MATSTQPTEVKFAEQLHEDKPPSIHRRLPRRASTLQYGLPADSSSDSESNGLRVASRRFHKRTKNSSWYNRLRKVRHRIQKKDSQAVTPPAPIQLAQTKEDTEDVKEGSGGGVDHTDIGIEPVPTNEDYPRVELRDVEENRNSPRRGRFGFWFSRKRQTEGRRTAREASSDYYYSDYTSSSSATSSAEYETVEMGEAAEMVEAPERLMVYHCREQILGASS